MRPINQDEQKKIQLRILSRFIDICERHHLRYSVIDGTLLGTIRHKGYIPWDDDVDVAMPRADYDRFIKLYKKQYNDATIKIIDHKSEKKYHMLFAKLYDSSTVLRERKVIEKYAQLYGIYIDIFPLDYVSKDENNRKKFLKNNYYFLRLITMNVLNTEVPHSNKWTKYVYDSLRIVFKVVPISILTAAEEKRIRRYSEANKDSGCLRELAYGDSNTDYYFFEADFDTYITKRFEILDVKIPVGYDRVLRSQYGDYMQLPPESERINHGLDAYHAE